MFEISGVGVLAAFLGGALSFLSPCVLPLALLVMCPT
jgi:cytochrome c-type biogenesis protein